MHSISSNLTTSHCRHCKILFNLSFISFCIYNLISFFINLILWVNSPRDHLDCQQQLIRSSNSITEGFWRFSGEIQQMAFLPSPAVPLFIRGTRLLAGRTPSVGFQNLIFVWRENNTLWCYFICSLAKKKTKNKQKMMFWKIFTPPCSLQSEFACFKAEIDRNHSKNCPV